MLSQIDRIFVLGGTCFEFGTVVRNIGKLIPAGTGMTRYQEIRADVPDHRAELEARSTEDEDPIDLAEQLAQIPVTGLPDVDIIDFVNNAESVAEGQD